MTMSELHDTEDNVAADADSSLVRKQGKDQS